MTYDPAMGAKRRPKVVRQPKIELPKHPHGLRRASDHGERASTGSVVRRRANGTPLLLLTVLGILCAVGLTRVRARIQVLELAEEITQLTEKQEALLDRKRRLETERAYLRRPSRIREQALDLGMVHVPPEHIQRIRLLDADQEAP
jgi:cell division protein FtsL